MKIAAICGAPNYNSGMMFVDRALFMLLKKNNLTKNTTFFCFQPKATNKSGFEYQPLTKNVDLSIYDCIIIWGDFIVSNHLLKMIEPKIAKYSPNFIYDFTAKILCKELSDNELVKMIIYGQNIFIDKASIFSDEKYITSFKRLLLYCSLAKFRDPISAYKAKLISEQYHVDFLGLDAALLNYSLDKNLITKLRENDENNCIGIFFARSKNFNFKKKVLGKYLKYKYKNEYFKWIPWLENKQESKKYFKYANTNPIPTDIDILKELLSCKLIITDTYHLSLMAWSLGVPCICFGNASENFKTTIHDKKKEIFFLSNYLDEFYFYTENFYSDIKSGRLARIIEQDNKPIAELVSKKISEFASAEIALIENNILRLKKE